MNKKLLKKIKNLIFPAQNSIDFNFQNKQLMSDLDGLINSSSLSKIAQIQLFQSWKNLKNTQNSYPQLDAIEFRAFSQNGEDGILLYIFSQIGIFNKRVVEVCAGDGIQCNSANLIINHGWEGLLFDGNDELVKKGCRFYSSHPNTFSLPPVFVNAWIERETINYLISTHGFSGEIDLLSIDVDGVDYWIWDAIDIINPRVVVTEIQCIWGASHALTVPYSKSFQAPMVNGLPLYAGATLPAFVKLAKKKGYRLVGVNELGINAFFVKDHLCGSALPAVTPETCLNKPFVKLAQKKLLPHVIDKEWVEV